MNSPTSFKSWPAEKTARLKQLYYDGMACEAIAFVLDVISARAVREKVTREGFQRRPGFVVRPAKTQFIPMNEVVEVEHWPDEPQEAVRANGAPVTLANVDDKECRWMEGQPSFDTHVCGNKTESGSSWCPYHHRRVYPRAA